MKYRILFFIIILANNPIFLFAQNEHNVWYFGYRAGLDFNSGSVVALNDGQLNTTEGCSSICDSMGNLLFYTNGVTVWNKNHQIMPNGTGLKGHNSSTQSVIIVPFSNYPNLYYIFCTNGFFDGLTYSLLDMTLDNGLGDITFDKNEQLFLKSTEKLTATKHANGTDYWVVTHEQYSNKFLSYLIDSYGIRPPVISFAGDSLYDYSLGQMKISQNGKRIAFASSAEDQGSIGKSFVFDFDNITGKVSNAKLVSRQHYYKGPYGLEFSPSGNLLYVTEHFVDTTSINSEHGFLYQYDLNVQDIKLSEVIIYNSQFRQKDLIGSLQLGPDGRIYAAIYENRALGIINNPNVYGLGCNFVFNGISLSDGMSAFGLPNCVEPLFIKNDFTYQRTCYKDTTFFYPDIKRYDSLRWNFGDITTGIDNSSKFKNPTHVFSDTGTYTVRLFIFRSRYVDTITNNVRITGPKISLGNDTILCTGNQLNIQLPLATASYLWQDGTNSNSFTIKNAGVYWVKATQGSCIQSDTIKIYEQQIIKPFIGNDTLICFDDSLLLKSNSTYDTYLWNTGAVDSFININDKGTFWLSVTKNRCKQADTITIEKLSIHLGNDTIICLGQSLNLNTSYPQASVLWNTGDTSSVISVTDSGLYWVRVNQFSCFATDTLLVSFVDCSDCQLWVPTAFSPNNDGINDNLFPLGNCEAFQFKFKIFNRWGEMIYNSNEQTNGWDGTYKNILQDCFSC